MPNKCVTQGSTWHMFYILCNGASLALSIQESECPLSSPQERDLCMWILPAWVKSCLCYFLPIVPPSIIHKHIDISKMRLSMSWYLCCRTVVKAFCDEHAKIVAECLEHNMCSITNWSVFSILSCKRSICCFITIQQIVRWRRQSKIRKNPLCQLQNKICQMLLRLMHHTMFKNRSYCNSYFLLTFLERFHPHLS